MPTVKLDIYNGSELAKGPYNGLLDRAKRLGLVTGLTDMIAGQGDQLLDDAIDAFITSHPNPNTPTHPINTTLPLQRVTGKRFGKTSAWIVGEYFRTTATVSPGAARRIKTRMGYTATEWYSSAWDENNGNPAFDGFGLPTGNTFEFLHGGTIGDRWAIPKVRLWVRPTVVVSVPFSLSSDPSGQLAPLMGHVNDSNIVFNIPGVQVMGNLNITAGFMRFESVDVDAVTTGSGTTYYGHYHFSYVYGGWYGQKARYTTGWTVQTRLVYPQANFVGAFP